MVGNEHQRVKQFGKEANVFSNGQHSLLTLFAVNALPS
jgi:hypothetical protein